MTDRIEEMTLDQIRVWRGLTQTQLSEVLQMTQAAVSKLEFRNDSYVSSVRRYIEALGGQIEIHAVFPAKPSVKIRGLDGDDMLATLRPLVNKLCRVNPLGKPNDNNRFLFRSINDREVELEKTSCANLVHIPIRRIVEVLRESASGKLPTLMLNGTVQWLDEIERWRFVE